MWHRGLPNYQASNHLSPYSHLTKTKYPPSTQSLTSSLVWNHVVVHPRYPVGVLVETPPEKCDVSIAFGKKPPFIVGKVKLRKEESRRSQLWTSWSGGTGLLKMITDPKLKTWKFWEWPTERDVIFALETTTCCRPLCTTRLHTYVPLPPSNVEVWPSLEPPDCGAGLRATRYVQYGFMTCIIGDQDTRTWSRYE